MPDLESLDFDDFERVWNRAENICQIKVDAVTEIVKDETLPADLVMRLVSEVLNAPGWTVHHVLARQRASRPASPPAFMQERGDG